MTSRRAPRRGTSAEPRSAADNVLPTDDPNDDKETVFPSYDDRRRQVRRRPVERLPRHGHARRRRPATASSRSSSGRRTARTCGERELLGAVLHEGGRSGSPAAPHRHLPASAAPVASVTLNANTDSPGGCRRGAARGRAAVGDPRREQGRRRAARRHAARGYAARAIRHWPTFRSPTSASGTWRGS